MRKSALFFLFVLLSFDTFSSAFEPKHEYEKPGYNPGHAYDGIVPEESIDLFSGALNISHRDVALPNYSAFDSVLPLLLRSYSSKIYRQDILNGVCIPRAIPTEEDYMGLGWTLHFGRLRATASGFVLELPDGSSHIMVNDTLKPAGIPNSFQHISKSMWILRHPSTNIYEAISPGPDSVKLTFDTAIWDALNGATNYPAVKWSMQGNATSTMTIFYEKPGVIQRPNYVSDWCGSNLIDFAYDVNGNLDYIDVPSTSGTSRYQYTVAKVATGATYPYVLTHFEAPAGNVYDYEYDLTTYELKKLIISSKGSSTNLTINYTYADKLFYSPIAHWSQICTRVVTQKTIGASSWTYTYPATNSATWTVEVLNPSNDKTKVTFQGYAQMQSEFWNLGSILSQQTLEGSSTNLLTESFTYDDVTVSGEKDPDADPTWNLAFKIPVKLQATKTYSDGQQAVTSFGAVSNYDRFGNPSLMIEKGFDGLQVRKTEYAYAYTSQPVLKDNNFIRALSRKTVYNSTNTKVFETTYEYGLTTTYHNFGLLTNSYLWNTGLTTIEKKYTYNSSRELIKIEEEKAQNSFQSTDFVVSCGLVTDANDGLSVAAGALFDADLFPNKLYSTTRNANGFATTYLYDSARRLTRITPPSGIDLTTITYSDINRTVTVAQGTSSTIETYDTRGRLTQSKVKLNGTEYSYKNLTYDIYDNLLTESEKSTSSSGAAVTTRTYDALNRVLSVVTFDGTTTFTYTGPDVAQKVSSEIGLLTTTLKYDALGRLISVTEPDNSVTNYTYDALDRLTNVDQGSLTDREFTYDSRGNLLTEKHPESGQTTYTYDYLNRLTEKTYQDGNAIKYETYDARGRLGKINYTNETDVDFYYDGASISGTTETYVNKKGRLTGMVDASGITTWPEFSSNGQLKKRNLYWSGIPKFGLTYEYDTRGNLSALTYPTGQKISLPRNEGNAIKQIDRTAGGTTTSLLSSITYNAALLPKSLSYLNGITVNIPPDTRNRPSSISATGKLTLGYTYNFRGLISSISTAQFIIAQDTLSPSKTWTLTYDNLARINEYKNGTSTLNYDFDRYGNLTLKSGLLSKSLFYSSNRINGASYSTSGNQTSYNGKTLAYSDDNKVKTVTGGGTNFSYIYDGNGNRVISTNNTTANSQYYLYDESGTLIAEAGRVSGGPLYWDKDYVNGPTGTLATINYDEVPKGLSSLNTNGGAGAFDRVRIHWKESGPNCRISGYQVSRSTSSSGPFVPLNDTCINTSYFYDDFDVTAGTTYYYQVKTMYTDGTAGTASGTISQVYSTSSGNLQGPLAASYTTAPIYYNLNDHLGTTRIVADSTGKVIGSYDYYPFGEIKSEEGCTASQQKFTGKLEDEETGLQYFGARHMSNELTRFTSVDPARNFTPDDPQSWNRYGYAKGNPVNRIDRDGMDDEQFYDPYSIEAQLTIPGMVAIVAAQTFVAAGGAWKIASDVINTAASLMTKDSKAVETPATQVKGLLDGATKVRGKFPHEAKPGETLYRADPQSGKPTHYQVYREDGLPDKRVDLTGAPHGDTPTPHVQEYGRGTNKDGVTFPIKQGKPRPAKPEEIP